MRFIRVNPGPITTVVRPSRQGRQCVKCNVSKSPAWRSGPHGGTWCNKCSLRHRREMQKQSSHRPATQLSCLIRPQEASNTTPDASASNEVAILKSLHVPEHDSPDVPAHDSPTPSQSLNLGSTSVTHESNSLSMNSNDELDVIGSYEIGNYLSFDVQSHEPHQAVFHPELSQIPGDFNRGWVVTENLAPSTRTGSNPPPPVSQLDIVPYDAEIDTLGFNPVQLEYGSDQPGFMLQDYWVGCSSLDDTDVLPASNTYPSSGQDAVVSLQCRQPGGARSPEIPLSPLLSFSAYDSPSGILSGPSSVIRSHSRQQTGPQAPQCSFIETHRSVHTTPRGAESARLCSCSTCILRIFFDLDKMTGRISESLLHRLAPALATFFRRATAVHFAALQGDSSLYVATQAFVCDLAGEPNIVSTVAVLSEQFELASSNAGRYGELAAASCDLVFDFAIVGVAANLTSINSWLHEKLLTQYLSSERTKFAVWNLGRLPPGDHCRNSPSFRWLKRYLHTIPTSSGPQIAMDVQSGSDEHQFRIFHKAIVSLSNPANRPIRGELCAKMEPAIQDASVRSCQEWFVAVLDEAARRLGKDSQLQFLEAHKSYMLTIIEIDIQPHKTMGIDSCLHVCSLHCTSHFQPSFQSLLQGAQDTLRDLFSPLEALLHDGCGIPPIYPTRDHIFCTRMIGLILSKLYVTTALLPKEKFQQHFLLVYGDMASARRDLVESTQSELIWNYLPVEIAQHAASKLDRALTSFAVSPTYIA